MLILKKLLKYYLIIIAIFLLGRIVLFGLYFERFSTTDSNYFLSFLYGLKMDTIVASMLLVIPLVILTFSPKSLAKISNLFLRLYFIVVLGLIIYIENATFPFFTQYDVRPNFKFVEYLEYPIEVFNMIIADYKLSLFIAFLMIGIFIWFFLKQTKDSFMPILESSMKTRLLWFLPLALLLFIGIRSSFGHRPANISDAMYSNNRILNEVTNNSLYSVGYAIYANQKYASKVMKLYGKMPVAQALTRVEERLGIQGNDLNSTSLFSRLEKSHFPSEKKKNLVIFLQESLGYQFITPEITPELLKLKKESLWFSEAYSNGTRSIRGIAGSTAGFLAVPGKGVLKRSKSQSGFFTFASLLKPLGYHSMFLYGGEARFDNMRSWFLGNGFDEIVEEKDYVNPINIGTWGASDEDLANKGNERFSALYAEGKPFAAIMFSSSNHSPFDIPEGRIEPVKKGEKCVENAIQYADYAIGKFFADAKKLPYYKDTVFVVVADHNIRVYGDDVVPVNMFHIPALIMGEGIEAQEYTKISSQPDVLATAIDYLGKDLHYPILGQSIFSDNKQELTLLQFNENYALRVKNKVAVVVPNQPAETYEYVNEHLKRIEHDVELEKDALAFVITLNHLYNKQLYK
ncbi:MAG: Phosphoglycerol transferase I (EC [uncultured Sulfurovum sp.]|uniref:Phosphoglycerol transferase I (EC) n=1 Tax=uncultured Sulfurovum sp. TaxID=269237 RepID=A0A6S6TLR4_9BACT|nr:MAG: Phosphoglycerol transferase I (EC [uncultured Sulfurovum sp.]